MTRKEQWMRMTAVAAILGAGFALEGCQSIRQATGAIKQAPDEFTVLTKAPLVIPPDYNLRPPQPGVASRNEVDPDAQAQAALFQPSSAEQATALGTQYSDGEKFLLARSNALVVDPNIRRTVNADAGQEDQGPEFANKVLYEGAAPPPPRVATVSAPALTAPSQQQEGFFARNFGIGGSSNAQVTEVAQPAPVVQPAPVQPAFQPQPVGQPILQPQVAAAPQYVPPQQPVMAPAPQIVAQAAPAPIPQVAGVPQYVPPQPAPVPQMVAAPQYVPPQPAQQMAVVPAISQPEIPAEQPGWFTRNFVMSPAQRAALAAGQPLPPSVTQQRAAQQQAQVQQYQQQITPQYAQVQPAQQYVNVNGQPVLRQVAATPPPRRPEPKNLYQYLFGTPEAAAATVTPVQAQQQYIQPAPQPGVQPAPQPIPQAQPQPQPAQQEGWWSRNFGL